MEWESFYNTHPSPSNYESTITVIENFVCNHKNEKIALVTVSICNVKIFNLGFKIKTFIYKLINKFIKTYELAN